MDVSDTPTFWVWSDNRNNECKGFHTSVVPMVAEHFYIEWTSPLVLGECIALKQHTRTNRCAVLSVSFVLGTLEGNTASCAAKQQQTTSNK